LEIVVARKGIKGKNPLRIQSLRLGNLATLRERIQLDPLLVILKPADSYSIEPFVLTLKVNQAII